MSLCNGLFLYLYNGLVYVFNLSNLVDKLFRFRINNLTATVSVPTFKVGPKTRRYNIDIFKRKIFKKNVLRYLLRFFTSSLYSVGDEFLKNVEN